MDEATSDESGSSRARGPSMLERVAEWLVLACVVIGPLALGAVDTEVTLALAGAECLALALLCVGRVGRSGLAAGPLLGVMALVVLAVASQLLPVPFGLLESLAPVTAELVRFDDPKGLAWHPISLDPPATARELARALGLLSVVVVLRQRATSGSRGRTRAMTAVAATGLVVALIAVGHLVAGVDTLFGVHAWMRAPKLITTFGNENHLAGLLNASAIASVALAVESGRGARRLIWGASAILCAAGSIYSDSVAGRIALVLGLAVLALCRMRPVLDTETESPSAMPLRLRESGPVFAIALAIALAPLVAVVSGVSLRAIRDAVPEAFARSKLEPARVAISMLRAQRITGIGRGAFETVHPKFVFEPYHVAYTHVENEPLQAFAELGMFVGALLVLIVIGAARKGWKLGRVTWLEAGAMAASAALLVHSLADFGLEFAGGGILAALIATPQRGESRWARIPVLPALIIACVFLGLVPLLARRAMPDAGATDAEFSRLVTDLTVSFAQLAARAEEALRVRPADPVPAEAATTRALADQGGAKLALPWVNRLLFLNPMSGEAHLLAARTFARLGNRDQALLEARVAGNLGVSSMPFVLERWRDRDSIMTAAPTVPMWAREAAKILEGTGHKDEAFDLALLARDGDPDDINTLDYLVHVACRTGRSKAAIDAATAYRERLPGVAHAWVMEAEALECAGRHDDAVKAYSDGFEQHPGSELIVLAWANHHAAQRQHAEALVVLSRMRSEASLDGRFSAYMLRASELEALGRKQDAYGEYLLSLQLHPENSDIRLSLARICIALGQYSEAEAYLANLHDHPAAAPMLEAISSGRRAAHAEPPPTRLNDP